MDHGYRVLGFAVILVLYATVGLMAATGTIHIARKVFSPKAEQIFYAMFLILVAGFYLAFAAYFGASDAWRLEATVVLGFVVMALLGLRLPFLLIIGFSVHGIWDLLHELHAHEAWSPFAPGQITAIPLAYGIFCLAFDLFVAAYCYTRRQEWTASWKKALPVSGSRKAAV